MVLEGRGPLRNSGERRSLMGRRWSVERGRGPSSDKGKARRSLEGRWIGGRIRGRMEGFVEGWKDPWKIYMTFRARKIGMWGRLKRKREKYSIEMEETVGVIREGLAEKTAEKTGKG